MLPMTTKESSHLHYFIPLFFRTPSNFSLSFWRRRPSPFSGKKVMFERMRFPSAETYRLALLRQTSRKISKNWNKPPPFSRYLGHWPRQKRDARFGKFRPIWVLTCNPQNQKYDIKCASDRKISSYWIKYNLIVTNIHVKLLSIS